jgi:hypothetical protein
VLICSAPSGSFCSSQHGSFQPLCRAAITCSAASFAYKYPLLSRILCFSLPITFDLFQPRVSLDPGSNLFFGTSLIVSTALVSNHLLQTPTTALVPARAGPASCV